MNDRRVWTIAGLTCLGAFMIAGPAEPTPGNRVRLTLGETVAQVLAQAPAVLAADARARRAGEALRETRAIRQPQVAFGSGLAYNNGFPLSLEGSAPSIFQVGASMPLWNQTNKYLVRAAGHAALAGQAGRDSARNNLAAAVALVYYDLFQARRQEPVRASELAAVIRQQEEQAALLQAGRARPVDLAMAGAAVARGRQRLLVVGEEARMAETQLREWLGLPESSALDVGEPLLPAELFVLPVESLLPLAVGESPEIRQAEADVRARQDRVRAERGGFYPRVDLVGEYALLSEQNNYQDYFNRFTRNNFLVGLSIQVPVFSGNRVRARVAGSRVEADEAELLLQEMKNRLRMELERCLSALRVGAGAMELARLEAAAAEENVKVQESLFQNGRVLQQEVDHAREQWDDRVIARFEAEKTLFSQQVELLRLCGRLPGILPSE